MIIFGINNTPMIASTFGGPRIAQLFYDNLNYRWAFGAFCIMLVGICFPVAGVMLFMQMQSRKKGMLPRERSGRRWHQSVYYYLVQFDGEWINRSDGPAQNLTRLQLSGSYSSRLPSLSFCCHSASHNTPPTAGLPHTSSSWRSSVSHAGCYSSSGSTSSRRRSSSHGTISKTAPSSDPACYTASCSCHRRWSRDSRRLSMLLTTSRCWNGYFGNYLQVVHRLSITASGYVLGSYGLGAAVMNPIIGG